MLKRREKPPPLAHCHPIHSGSREMLIPLILKEIMKDEYKGDRERLGRA